MELLRNFQRSSFFVNCEELQKSAFLQLDRGTTCSTEFENAEKRNILATSHVDSIEAENEPSRLVYNLVMLAILENK